jgi:D-amino-acid dehydrogenase
MDVIGSAQGSAFLACRYSDVAEMKVHDTANGHYAVVGAGIVGMSCALHLQRVGVRTTVFDLRGPGEGASLGNAGIVALSEVLPLSRPGILRKVPQMLVDPEGPLVIRPSYACTVAPWLARFLFASRNSEVVRISKALASLMSLAVDAWKEILHETRGRHLLASNGYLRAYNTYREFNSVRSDIERQRALGICVELIGSDEVRDLEPALAPTFAGAAFYPDCANVLSPLLMTRALASSFMERGGTLLQTKVTRIEANPGASVCLYGSEGNTYEFDGVVIAAGAWSRTLVRTLGADIPLDTERGYHAMLPTPKKSLRRPVTVPSPGFSLVQMTDGIRLTSGVEFAGLDAPPDFRRLRRMISHAVAVLPGLSDEPVTQWLGFRPSMPRSLPIIGPLPDRPNVLLAFGHGHVGLTLGPITGSIIAAVVTNSECPVDISPFLPKPSRWRPSILSQPERSNEARI